MQSKHGNGENRIDNGGSEGETKKIKSDMILIYIENLKYKNERKS